MNRSKALPQLHALARASAIFASVAFTYSATAQTGTWNVNASGDWSDALNWTPGIADGPTATANFTNNISATRTVNLDTARQIGNINFSDNGSTGQIWNLSSDNGSVLTLGNGTAGASTINTLTNATISLNLAGANSLTKTGVQVLTLSGNNTYSGETVISGGALRIEGANALSSNSNLRLNGGVLGLTSDFTRAIGTGAGQVTWGSGATSGGFAAFGGNHTVNFGGAGATQTWTNTTGTFNSTLVLGYALADGTVTIANGILLNSTGARTVQVNNGSAEVDAVLSGVLSQTQSRLIKTGTGTLALTGANTHGTNLGATNNGVVYTVSAGTLQFGNGGTTGSTTSTGHIDVAGGATFAVSRSDAMTLANRIMGAGDFRQIGAGTTTLAAASDYTGATFVTNGTLVASVANAISASSGISVSTGGTLRLAGDGINRIGNAVPLSLAGGTFSAGDLSGQSELLGTFNLTANSFIDFGTGTGNTLEFSSVGARTDGATLSILNWTDGGSDRLIFGGVAASFSNLYTQGDVLFNGLAGYQTVDLGGGRFEVISAIPEPSSVALLASITALGWGVMQRRRRVSPARA